MFKHQAMKTDAAVMMNDGPSILNLGSDTRKPRSGRIYPVERVTSQFPLQPIIIPNLIYKIHINRPVILTFMYDLEVARPKLRNNFPFVLCVLHVPINPPSTFKCYNRSKQTVTLAISKMLYSYVNYSPLCSNSPLNTLHQTFFPLLS
jgi:hypothetical protein